MQLLFFQCLVTFDRRTHLEQQALATEPLSQSGIAYNLNF